MVNISGPNNSSSLINNSGVRGSRPAEETQQSRPDVGSSRSIKESQAVQTSTPKTVDKPVEVQQKESIARPMKMGDVVDQLFMLQKPLTAENKEIILTMIQHGVEASEENFDRISKMNKRKGGNMIESAVVALSKGLTATPQSIDILSQFLTQNAQFAKSLQELRQSFANFQASLATQSGLNAGLVAGIGSVLEEFEKNLKKISSDDDDRFNLSKFDRGALVKDLQTFQGFLKGLFQKFGADNPLLNRSIQGLGGRVRKFLDHLASQAILSKDSLAQQLALQDKFMYWQFPNPFLRVPADIHLLIRKDPGQKKRKIDPKKTRMVLRLETEDLGELGVTIDLLDQKVWYLFQTSNFRTQKHISESQNDLIDRMQTINYKTQAIRSEKKKVDLKKLLLPTFNLDSISRISTEI